MSFRTVTQISRRLSKIHSHCIENFVVKFRNFASNPPKVEERQSCCTESAKCPNTTCQNEKLKKKSFWSVLLGKRKDDKLPPIECCRVKQAECRQSPDLSQFEGTPYSTCGSAFIIANDMVPSDSCKNKSAEMRALRKMEASLGMKDNSDDPMPEFTSVEQRMLDLSDKRLHPSYRRLMNVPKKRKASSINYVYKTRKGGPILPHEIPGNLKFNKALLDRKNLYADYKRVEPPSQLVANMIEMKQNARPTMGNRMPVVPSDAKHPNHRKTIADTLYQKEHKF